ncbi:MAG: hypothetical protein RLP44_02745 [Aggregatilineales bacterium]
MSKQRKNNPSAVRKKRQSELLSDHYVPPPQDFSPIQRRVVEWLLRRSRIERILIVSFIALMIALVVVVLFYTVDNRFLLAESGESIPLILYVPVIFATILGLVIYLLGWRYLVNIYEADESAPNVILWYLGVGVLATFINCGWILNVISVLNNPI